MALKLSHHEEWFGYATITRITSSVELYDVRVSKRHQNGTLALEQIQRNRIRCVPDGLNGDFPRWVVIEVERGVHLAHTAAAEALSDLVPVTSCPGRTHKTCCGRDRK